MGTYLLEVSYTAESWAKQLKHPVDRINDVVKPFIEGAGGKVVCGYYAFGDSDIILIVEGPDNVSAAALSLAVSASGALSKCETTVLMSASDGVAAMKKAAGLAGGYKPPS